MFVAAFNVRPAKARTIIVPDDYATIQAAINAASSGDTVFVKAGTYYERVVVDKSLSIVGENPVTTTIDGSDGMGTVVTIIAEGVKVTGFIIRNNRGTNTFGVRLESTNNTIYGNTITNNAVGVQLALANNTIYGNTITNNFYGVLLVRGRRHSISRNNIQNNEYGVWGILSSSNRISENNVAYNDIGVKLSESSNNSLYHNNFIDNTRQVYDSAWKYPEYYSPSVNVWDDGYPSGGNYWSNYEERYPDAEELDGSGIWDIPYFIDGNNRDRYPLINSYTVGFPYFELEVSPPSQTVSAGGSATYAVSVKSFNGFDRPVSLRGYAQTGITLSFAPETVTPSPNGNAQSQLTVTASSGLAAGNYPISIKGEDVGGQVRWASAEVVLKELVPVEEFVVIDDSVEYTVRVYFSEVHGDFESILDSFGKPEVARRYFPGITVPLHAGYWAVQKVEVLRDGNLVQDEQELSRVLKALSGWVLAKYTADNSFKGLSSCFEIFNEFTKRDKAPQGALLHVIGHKNKALDLQMYVTCPSSLLEFGLWKDAVTRSIELSFLAGGASPDFEKRFETKLAEHVDEIIRQMDTSLVTDEVKDVVGILVTAFLVRTENARVLSFLREYASERGITLDSDFEDGLTEVIAVYGVTDYEEAFKYAIRKGVEEAVKTSVKKTVEELLNRALPGIVDILKSRVSEPAALAFSAIAKGVAKGYVVADLTMNPCGNFRLVNSHVASMVVAREYGKLEKELMNDLASSKNIDLEKAHALTALRKMQLSAMGQSYAVLAQMGELSLLNRFVSWVGEPLGSVASKKEILDIADIFLLPAKDTERVTRFLLDQALGKPYHVIDPLTVTANLFRGEEETFQLKITPPVVVDVEGFETFFLHGNSPKVAVENVASTDGETVVDLRVTVPHNADMGSYRAIAVLRTKGEYAREFTVFLDFNILPDNILRVEILSPKGDEIVGPFHHIFGGENIEIKAKVTTRKLFEVTPVTDAEVQATIETRGLLKTLRMDHKEEGIYSINTSLEEAQLYTLRVTAEKKYETFFFVFAYLYEPGSELREFLILPESATTVKLQETEHKLYLHVYDSQNRHVGVDYATNQTRIEIPGASYHDFQDGTTIIILPSNITSFRYLVDAKYAVYPVESYNITLASFQNGQAVSTLSSSSEIKQGEKQQQHAQILGDGRIQIQEKPWQIWLGLAVTGFIAASLAVAAVILHRKRKRTT